MKDEFLDRNVFRYLNKIFKDATFVKGYRNIDLSEPWNAIILDVDGKDEILVGGPVDYDTWFYHGPILSHIIDLFSISRTEFTEILKRYIKEKYSLEIKIII